MFAHLEPLIAKTMRLQPSDTGIVLDKSYLQGASPEEVHMLCSERYVLMPDVLFCELLSADAQERAACFRKLPQCENPVELMPAVGDLLDYEVKNSKACTPLKSWAEQPFIFNVGLCEPGFKLTKGHLQIIQKWEITKRNELNELVRIFTAVQGFFPDLKNLAPSAKPELIADIRLGVARNPRMIQDIYGAIRHPSLPDPSVIDHNWAFFRWVQVYLLAALEYFHKYGAGLSRPKAKKLLHESLDLDYCITATLAGGLASRDKPMTNRFQLLRPDGALIT